MQKKTTRVNGDLQRRRSKFAVVAIQLVIYYITVQTMVAVLARNSSQPLSAH